MVQAALRTDVGITDEVTLTSLTSYVHFKQNQGDDGEGLPAISLDLTPSTGKIDSFAQELRLSNGGDHPLRWVAGANYEKSKVYQDIFVRTQDSSTGYLFGGIGYPNFATLDYYSDQKMENYAFFGNVEYDLVDHVTLKGGSATPSRTVTPACAAATRPAFPTVSAISSMRSSMAARLAPIRPANAM
ncbi:hypothetical protein ACFSTI_14715 [Rhizorhabdus histidinilytica]